MARIALFPNIRPALTDFELTVSEIDVVLMARAE
jgi:hypothetical protein